MKENHLPIYRRDIMFQRFAAWLLQLVYGKRVQQAFEDVLLARYKTVEQAQFAMERKLKETGVTAQIVIDMSVQQMAIAYVEHSKVLKLLDVITNTIEQLNRIPGEVKK